MDLLQKIEAKGIKIKHVAKMLGISHEFISRIVNGKQGCSDSLLVRINAYLDHLNSDSLPEEK